MDFDFSFQPSINQAEIEDLNSLRFLAEQQNVLFVGNSGVCKTHLATALGIECCRQGERTRFIQCGELIRQLEAAYDQNREKELLQKFFGYSVLIIDEIGYLPISRIGAELFFQLIEKRYERKTNIITTNIALSQWGTVFSDKKLANPILDRLIHRSRVIKITGQSYRMRGHVISSSKN
ncbi:hypothetical protein XA3_21500 [Xylocopilactobacillus apicola]|uniref:AAA+ ATPase domain-containing protein n=1 Tax=Xylocopilactobacillus apicola TaxID=2932184 RepID=A0AAU9D758_9LACO|nr:hypothetical protein XA3_21500 [Xylocopilactobacillus apicola]